MFVASVSVSRNHQCGSCPRQWPAEKRSSGPLKNLTVRKKSDEPPESKLPNSVNMGGKNYSPRPLVQEFWTIDSSYLECRNKVPKSTYMSSNFRRILPFQANLTDKNTYLKNCWSNQKWLTKQTPQPFSMTRKTHWFFEEKTIHFESREESRKKKLTPKVTG